MYILICDDEPAVARQVEQLARQHLEQRGIPVQCAVCTRGEEVLARSDLAQYQLALLDVDLETMTGIALSLMLQQNDVAGARGYLTSISKTIQMNSAILNTHNPLLDALLSKKYEEAARKGVMMYFDLSDLKDIPLDRTHLVIVVSNLLNNAIEAAAQAAPPEVHVRMKKTEGELVISVRNRVRQNVEIPEGQLPRSTKREPGHGMGLANVCAVLEAHNAEYTLSCRDNWFRFTCAFPTNGI